MADITERVSRNVAGQRRRRGWSQEELARRAGCSRTYLARIELGQHDPAVGMLEKIARALRVSVATLLK